MRYCRNQLFLSCVSILAMFFCIFGGKADAQPCPPEGIFTYILNHGTAQKQCWVLGCLEYERQHRYDNGDPNQQGSFSSHPSSQSPPCLYSDHTPCQYQADGTVKDFSI